MDIFVLKGCCSQLDEGTPPEPEGSFVDYQTTMVKFSKAIAITAQEMVSYSCLTLCVFHYISNLQ